MTEEEIKKLLAAAFTAGYEKGSSDWDNMYWMRDTIPVKTACAEYVEKALGK